MQSIQMNGEPSNGMKLSDIKTAHFIGIGGIGMSGLARLFLHEGKTVSGSDRVPTEITEALIAEGVRMFPFQEGENITEGIDLVVYTEAMPKDHEELFAAREKGIHCMNYFDALGMVANEYYLIAVSGSHGKTTTTAMLIDIFEEAGLDPSAIVGSLRSKTKSNYRAGKSKYFIVEACEYKRDFMSLEPDILVITNIEHEHVDYYKDLEAVQRAFKEFVVQVREGGAVIVNFGGENIAPILEGLHTNVIDYGKYFDPLLTLKVPGMHNQMNASAALAVAEYAGISKEIAESTLAQFAGTWRRFEYKGECNGAKVYDDYGHHPTEIKATIQGARDLYPDKKITVVFQSHTYTRTNVLFDDFVSALATADVVYTLPIYKARDEDAILRSHISLSIEIEKAGIPSGGYNTVEQIIEDLKPTLAKDDVVLTMGAGDMTTIVANSLVS